MASRRKPGAGSTSAPLERARELLRVVEDAHAAYEARRPEPEGWPEDEPIRGVQDGWTHATRAHLLPALHAALDELQEDAASLPWVGLLVVTGPQPARGEPYPTRRATLEDVVAWLEAVVEPEPEPSRDVTLVTLDWGIMHPASELRVPPSEVEAHAGLASGSATAGGVTAEPEPAHLELTGAPVTVTVTVTVPASGLAQQGADTVALERTLARAPLFAASSVRHGLQLELGLWRTTGSLYGQPFRVLEPRGPLTVRDALGLAHLIRRWADMGYPEDRRVRVSENEAVGWFGYSTTGGRQRGLLRDAMGRLRATTFQSASEERRGRSETLTWGLIDYARTPRTGPEGRVSVTLSEPLAYLVQSGKVAYLDAPTFAALVEEDELAARLWVFLEAEELPWRWSLYSAPEGEPAAERDTPAIADLLRISGWERRRDVARRVTQAVRAIERVDPRYRLAVARAPKGRGMWTLQAGARVGTAGRAIASGGSRTGVLRDAREGTAGRTRGVLRDAQSRSKRGGTVVSLPSVSTDEILPRKRETPREPRSSRWPAPSWDEGGAVLEAWRERYPRPPTSRQLRVLAELVANNDAPGIAHALRDAPPGEDALRAVMARDSRDDSARRRELQARARAAGARQPSGVARVGAVLEEVAPPVPAPRPAPAPPAEPEPEDEAEVAARRRANAVAMLRGGLEGDMAARIRAQYGLTDADIWPERA